MDHVWLRHKEHGGHWQVPAGVVDEMRTLGWEPSEPPEETNPAVVERIAWEREQEAARAAQTTKPTKPRRGESQE